MQQILEHHLEKLSGFAAVAAFGSIHKAARRLKISQPALTRSMKILEEAVGAKLFNRSNQGIVLTPAGKVLELFCQKLNQDLVDLGGRIQNPHTELAGQVTIATYESLSVYFWPGFLRRFQKKHPHIHINLITHDEKENWTRLQLGTVHLIVDAEPESNPQIESTILYRDHFDLFVSQELRHANDLKAEVSVEECSTLPFIYVPKALDKNRQSIKEHLENFGIQHSLQFSLDSFVTALAFAKEGQGIAVLPKRLVEKDVAQKRLFPLRVRGIPKSGFGEHRFCASYLQRSKEDARIRALVQELKLHFLKSKLG